MRVELPCVLVAIAACGGTTSAGSSPDASSDRSTTESGTDAAASGDGTTSPDGSAGDGASADSTAADSATKDVATEASSGDAGSFACPPDTCDSNTQFCMDSSLGPDAGYSGTCMAIPAGCGHDCTCIQAMFQCLTMCTNDSGRITVKCG